MSKPHTRLAKVIHWSFVVLYAYGIFKQVDDLSQLEDRGLLLFEVAFATLFLVIVLMRYSYMRRFDTFQGAREPVPKVHTYFAKAVHFSMYACFILLPLTGLAIAGLYTQGYTENATPDEVGNIMDVVLDLHGTAADLSYFLIVLHISAALWSRLKGEGVWSSMVPILQEKEPSKNKIVTKISTFEDKFYNRVENFFATKEKN
tara:strand:- start:72 stop:680 length:609 start_codon:yes stop_codon:yes gene_type:complete